MYRIITDSDTDTPASILDDSNEDIPKVGDSHPVNASVTVKERRVRFTGARSVYILEVSYDNAASTENPGGGGGGGGQIDVGQVTLTNWWEDYILEYSLDKNAAGTFKRMANTSGDPIKYESRRPHPMITISAVTKDPGLANIVGAVGSVNLNRVSWLGLDFEPGQLLYDSYDATSSGNKTWRETFVFKAKYQVEPDQYGSPNPWNRLAGWQPWILDAGLWEWADQAGEPVKRPIYPVDTEGGKPSTKPTTEPWPLFFGKALPRDEIEQKRQFNQWTVYPSVHFGFLKFDFTKILTDEKMNELGI